MITLEVSSDQMSSYVIWSHFGKMKKSWKKKLEKSREKVSSQLIPYYPTNTFSTPTSKLSLWVDREKESEGEITPGAWILTTYFQSVGIKNHNLHFPLTSPNLSILFQLFSIQLPIGFSFISTTNKLILYLTSQGPIKKSAKSSYWWSSSISIGNSHKTNPTGY